MARVLVVEDNALIRAMLRDFLEGEGHEVEECADGMAVSEIMSDRAPDLVFLDIDLPGISGEDLAAAIKGNERTEHVPVVVLTRDGDEETRGRLLDLGVDEFLAKPFSPTQLRVKVRSLLRAKELSDRLLASFQGVEFLEHLNMELIHRLQDAPTGDTDFLIRALDHWSSWGGGMGAPTHMWVCADAPGSIEGVAITHRSGLLGCVRTTLLDRSKLVEILEPYRQTGYTYWSDGILAGTLRALWPDPPQHGTLAGVLEGGLWVLASGYARSVSVYDSRWLASLARQYQVFRTFLGQLRATEEAFRYTMEALARAAEVHDDSTGQHLLRVNAFSGFLAKALGCDRAFVKAVESTAMMHDVGKIHVHPEILKKAGPLSEAEMTSMKMHTLFGARILGDSPKLLMAREIALSHHERWDGLGYPNGLRGEEIPLEARIVALADVYDALRSRRLYKPPLSHPEAVNIIRNGDPKSSPRAFDPRCLEVFLDVSTHLDYLFRRFGEAVPPKPD